MGKYDFRPLEVRVDRMPIERAISMLKRKMANEGVFKELRKRKYHEKPSEKKKRKRREAERRRRKVISMRRYR